MINSCTPTEAICVVGGETYVEPLDWKLPESYITALAFAVAPSNGESIKGSCVNPKNCSRRADCRALVTYTKSERNNIGKAIIETIVFNSRDNISEFEDEDSSTPLDWPDRY